MRSTSPRSTDDLISIKFYLRLTLIVLALVRRFAQHAGNSQRKRTRIHIPYHFLHAITDMKSDSVI